MPPPSAATAGAALAPATGLNTRRAAAAQNGRTARPNPAPQGAYLRGNGALHQQSNHTPERRWGAARLATRPAQSLAGPGQTRCEYQTSREGRWLDHYRLLRGMS